MTRRFDFEGPAKALSDPTLTFEETGQALHSKLDDLIPKVLQGAADDFADLSFDQEEYAVVIAALLQLHDLTSRVDKHLKEKRDNN